jgi:phage I-like protein
MFVLPRIARTFNCNIVPIVPRNVALNLVALAGRSLASLGARSVEIAIDGDKPPTEFRLFKAGENETTKGVFIFDAKAAEMVLAAAQQRGGVDYPIDLEHLSLDEDSRNFDPDARGWFKLAVRNGELWAVDVRWTPDGMRRLSERTQRYVSPAFLTDDEGRVSEVVNVALVAMPATHGTPALVAAGARRPPMKLKDRINSLSARLSIAKGKITKLAEDGEAPAGKAAQVKAAAEKASTALDELQKAFGGGDIDATFAAMDAAKEAMDACENAIAAMTGAPKDADAAPAPDAAAKLAEDEKQKTEQMARKEAELVSLRNELAKRKHDEQVAKLAAEQDERRGLVATLVRLGRETPATAWADESATTPRGTLATMPVSELRERVKAFGGSPVALGALRPPTGHIEMASGCGISEREAQYVKARHGMLLSQGHKLRSLDETLIRYEQAKQRQIDGATEKHEHERAKTLAMPLRSDVISLARKAGLVALTTTPVQPIEEFGPSSQIALQSFRLEYNISLSSMPKTWAEDIGQMLSDGAMKTTFPISYDATQYVEKTTGNAAANQPLSFDIEVYQREFYAAKQVELRRLIKGDFAYVQRWAQSASEMARARVFLRNALVNSLLAGATSGYWGVTAKQATGIDGQPFFSASHAINPGDASRQLRGSATFSNYQGSASALAAPTLTAEKNQALQVAAPDGRELGIMFDGILFPSSLAETAWNLLKVQDLIPQEAATSARASTTVRNPHYNSNLELVRAMDLAGSDTSANWYLFSREGIARGMPPWVICEDPTEEIRLWDEASDFYKDKGEIKIESHAFLNAVLAFPHCIRLVTG